MATIIIIDDSARTRTYLRELLEQYHHHIIEVDDMQIGLSVTKAEKPDLVITDILMSNIDGYEFVVEMKKDPELINIPVIFYTAIYRKEEAEMLGRDLNVKYVISKPADPHTILDTINTALGIQDPEPNIPETLTSSDQLPVLPSLINQPVNDLNHLEELNTKIANMFELNLSMVAEKDDKKLLEIFCEGMNQIIETECAVVGLIDNHGIIEHMVHSGKCENRSNQMVEKNSIVNDFIKELTNKPTAYFDNNLNSSSLILPFCLNTPTTILAAPLHTSTYVFGFVYFVNKNNPNGFTDDDIKVVEIFSAELCMLYEKIEMHKIIQKHAANLQVEKRKLKNAEEDLRQSQLIFQQFSENIEEVFFIATPKVDKIIYVNSGFEKIWGKSAETLYKNPNSWFESVLEEDKKEISIKLQAITDSIGSGNLNYRIRRPDGTIRSIFAKLTCLKDTHDNFINLIGVASDITEYVEEQKGEKLVNVINRLLEGHRPFKEVAPDLTQLLRESLGWEFSELWLVDLSKNVLRNFINSYEKYQDTDDFSNQTSHVTFGKDDGLPGKIWQTRTSLWFPDFSKVSIGHIRNEIAKDSLHQAIGFPIIFNNEVLGVITFYSKHIPKPDLAFTKLLKKIGSQIGDYIGHKYTEEQLIALSTNDIMTGLINRATIDDKLDTLIKEHPNQALAVVVIGIDRMALITQAFGFESAEKLLKAVAQRIQASNIQSTYVFRGGGSKIGFILSNFGDVNDIENFSNNLFTLLKTPFEIEDHKLVETISIGVSLYPQNATDSSLLLKYAGIANTYAQHQGGNQMQFFDKEIPSITSKKLALENSIHKAFENKEFDIYYQPKLNMKTLKVTGVEALLRWDDPRKGVIPAADFIKIAEDTGLIVQLGDWVIQEACRTLHELLSTHPEMVMSINISIRQFHEKDFLQKLEQVIEENDIPPSSVELEITENFIMNNPGEFKESINLIKEALGVRVALDNFGTGYSSLGYLTYGQIDSIKIDKSFIEGIPEVINNIAIIKAIVAIADVLAITSVAEGVETQEQWDFLSDAGCNEAQGFFCSMPLPKAQLLDYLQGDLNSYISNVKR